MLTVEEVISPFRGEVLKILYEPSAWIDQWETLLLIKTESGVEEVIMEHYGRVEQIWVGEGDYILPGMVLAQIRCKKEEEIE